MNGKILKELIKKNKVKINALRTVERKIETLFLDGNCKRKVGEKEFEIFNEIAYNLMKRAEKLENKNLKYENYLKGE